MKPSNATPKPLMLEDIKDLVHSRHMAMTGVLLMHPTDLNPELYGPCLTYVRAQHRIWGFTFREGRDRFVKDFKATVIGKE